MTIKPSAEQLTRIQGIRRSVPGLIRTEAVLGNNEGVIFVPGSLGAMVYIRYEGANTPGWPQAVRKGQTKLAYTTDAPVWVGYDLEGELAILGERIGARIAAGQSAVTSEVQDDPTGGWLDITRLTDLVTTVTLPPSMSVIMWELFYPLSGTGVFFPGNDSVDLTASVPGSGLQCLALTYLDTSTNLAAIATSTPRSATGGKDAFDYTDFEEATINAGASAIWSKFIQLYNGMTEVTESNWVMDARTRLQPQTLASNITTTVSTTDATVTTLASITVDELQALTITATITGTKDDYTASCGGTLTAVVRRASGGNVTLVGSVTTDIHEDSAGSPTFSLDVDTGTQTARIRVTGIAAENWQWTVKYQTVIA